MKTESINLSASIQYNPSYPPKDAKKAYIARITGRASGAVKFEREFLGEDVTLVEGDEGLYEQQDGLKKGGYDRGYKVLLSHPEYGLILSTWCDDADVAKMAKLLDDGQKIEDIVEVTNLRPSEKFEGRMIFDVAVRTATQAKKVAKSATVDSAIETCWSVLNLLGEKEAKKVMAELRKRLAPPKPAAEVEETETVEG